jgi:hypothetical protein
MPSLEVILKLILEFNYHNVSARANGKILRSTFPKGDEEKGRISRRKSFKQVQDLICFWSKESLKRDREVLLVGDHRE